MKQTWTRYNLFNPKTVRKTPVSFRTRVKLLFRQSEFSCDADKDLIVWVKYKRLGGRTYVLSVHKEKI